MWVIRTITSYQAERRQTSKRLEENTAERKARAERVLTHTLLLQRRHVELPSRSASQWPAPIRRYSTIHHDAHAHKHAQQAGCGSVTHFELYRTKSFVFFFTEQTHNKTRDEEHNKQQEQQLKAARRCEDARTEGLTIHSARDNWTLAVYGAR